MAYFRIELGSNFLEYKKTSTGAAQFHDEVCLSNTDEFKFFVQGVQVSREEAFEASNAILEAAWNKKNITHKRVDVCIGASNLPSNYHGVLVRR